MAYLDQERGVIVARVIYDGAPEAGKTTNVRRITDSISTVRRGELQSPGSTGPRTEFFDWLDFQGGYIHGYNLHCQILAVPGQFSLRHRRSHLLNSADAVVFVADSRPAALTDNVRVLEFLQDRLRLTKPHLPPVPFLIQANKQDLADAMSPLELAGRFGLDGAVPVLGSCAHTGEGVMQTFLIAIRLAAERVQELLRTNAIEGIAREDLSAQALYMTLGELEALPDEMQRGISRSVYVGQDLIEEADSPSARTPPVEPRTLKIPAASEIIAGHLWPPLKARSILAAINGAEDITVSQVVSRWAPTHAVEFRSANGWVLHTCDAWEFPDEIAGRKYLMRAVRRCLAEPAWVPEGRAFILSPEPGAWRFWMITRDAPTLHEMLARSLRNHDGADLSNTCRTVHWILGEIERAQLGRPHVGLGYLECLAVSEGRPVCLAGPFLESAPEDLGWRDRIIVSLVAGIRALVTSAREQDPSVDERLSEVIKHAKLDGRILDGFIEVVGPPAEAPRPGTVVARRARPR